MRAEIKHPAKFTDAILLEIDLLLDDGVRVLDPFAGTGRIHELRPRVETWGVEIEPEWATLSPFTVVGDALALPFDDRSFDAVVTSPTYGNRMADHHEAKDDSRRMTYRHTLGRPLHPSNSGQLQWGSAYRAFHERAWREAERVTRRLLVLNVSDHVRGGAVQEVVQWHRDFLTGGGQLSLDGGLGFVEVKDLLVETPRLRYGANHESRVPHEHVLVFEKAMS